MTAAYKRAPVRVAAALVLLSAVLLAIGSVVTSHPAVCTLCHGGHADAMATSAHRGIPCYDCHLPAGGWSIIDAKTDEFLSMYPAYASGRRVGQSGSGSRISRAACTACHLGVLSGTTKAKDLKIVHATCASEQGKCDTCHSEVAHPGAVRWPRSIDMGVCLGCHDSKSASVQCATCHQEGRTGQTREGLSAGGSREHVEECPRSRRPAHLHDMPRAAVLREVPRHDTPAPGRIHGHAREGSDEAGCRVRDLPQRQVGMRLLPWHRDAASRELAAQARGGGDRPIRPEVPQVP
jgi:hypothetical protein